MKESTTDKEKAPKSSDSKNSKASKPSRGFLSKALGLLCRLWPHNNDDYEKKLQNLSKEEAMVHTRLKRRSQTWKKFSRSLVLYSIIGEVLILGIALVITRSSGLSWQMRAIRVLPVFALPTLSILIYSSCASYNRLRARKDEKTLERLRAERQAKVNELKEKTKYYIVQQLIQKYDPDPTEKAAAASVLAERLGVDAGISVALISPKGSENATSLSHGKNENQDVYVSNHHSGSIIENKAFTPQRKTNGGPDVGDSEEESFIKNSREPELGMQHHSERKNGGWIARIAAMLVEEDPSHSYALICKKCHVHNGLAPKEDFQQITYFCPHCHTLNGGQPRGWKVELGVPAQLSPQPSNVGPEVTLLPSQIVRKDVTVSNLAGSLHLNTVSKVAEIKKVA